jgi:tetratricopeptide (TPR) repeat protein
VFFSGRQSRLAPLLGLVSLILFGSCSRKPQPAFERLAILRFENLSPDSAADWMGRAFAEVITGELSHASKIYAIPTSRLHRLNQVMGIRPVSAPGISAEAPLALAVGANRIGYGEYSIVNGRLRARLTIEDPQGRRVSQGPIEAAAGPSDLIGVATAIARQISSETQPYSTLNIVAVAAYAKAIESGDAAAVERYGEQAIAADPNFGMAYRMLAELKTTQQDRAGAMSILKAAAARGNAIAPADRIHLEMLAATLQGDRTALERAVTAQVQAAPADPVAWSSLAEALQRRHQFQQAVQAYDRALAIEPEDANAWNQLGYVAAYRGDLDTAMKALRRYQALRPLDPNALDSMGDVNMLTGHLQEAEQLYLQAYQNAPAFLSGIDLQKAAMARLMTGNVAGANAIAKDKGGAEWMWATGRRKEAFAALTAEVEGLTNRDAQGRGYSELAVWSMLLDDRDTAARMAEKAVASATPANSALVALARFVTLPPALPAEWASRAQQQFPNAGVNSIGDRALSYALLLNRHFEAAAPILKRSEEQNPLETDRSVAIELAWALIETGNFKDAAPLLRPNPVLPASGMGPFFGLYFPRLFQLRAMVADREGKADEARENRRIYAALGGTERRP